MSSLAEPADHNQRKRHKKTAHREPVAKKKKRKLSPLVDAVKGDKETIKLKIERDLLEELQLTSVSNFPKPLSEYVQDQGKLLDEVFTVLSRGDIEGMLPDILKGLRMKRIKELCAEQLAKLDSDAVMRILSGHEESVTLGTMLQATSGSTPVAPLDDNNTGSAPSSSTLHNTEFSDVSDQEQVTENTSTELDQAAVLSGREGSGGDRLTWAVVEQTEDKGNKSLEKTTQCVELDDPTCSGGGCDVRSDEDDLDINTAIEDTIDMELAGESPKNHNSNLSCKEAPSASKALHPTQDTKRRKKKHKGARESHRAPHSTSSRSSELVYHPTLESKLRQKLLARVQQESACRTSRKTTKSLPSNLPPPAAEPTVDSTDSRGLELQMKEKALKALLTKSFRKPG